MFTGLIQDIGTVVAVEKDGDWRITIETKLDLSKAPEGASICCAGCCLTIVEKGSDWFAVEVSQETLSKSGISNWSVGTKINLEPSLRLGDELGGHFVFGHLDGQLKIKKIEPVAGSHIFTIEKPTGPVAPKGSVTLDGVSLTVNEVRGDEFTVNIIPHTMSYTTLGQRKAGDFLNFEIDMLARYVASLLKEAA
jgi:riboflavin synthase